MKYYNLTKAIRVFISLLVIGMLFSTIGIHEAQASVHPSLYYTQAELDVLKTLKTAPSHSAMWNDLQTWANAHVNDLPPARPSDANFKVVTEDMRVFMDIMTFMYHMTGNTAYADAAVAWAYNVAHTWGGWFTSYSWEPGYARSLAVGISNVYYAFKDYMTAGQRAAILADLDANIYPIWDRYAHKPKPINGGALPNHTVAIMACVGFPAVAMGEDSAHSADYLALAEQCVEEAMKYGYGGTPESNDGGWFEGPHYGIRCVSYTDLYSFFDVLRRCKDIDYFDDYGSWLSQAGYYFIYINIDDDHVNGAVPMQLEDCTGEKVWLADHDNALAWLYLAAKEYTDGYYQQAAETYNYITTPSAYIWKSPDVTPLAISNLPLYRAFADSGIVFIRGGWGGDDLVFLFKSGASMNHAHPNQNTYMIYKGGRPLTAGPGYVTTWNEYKVTQFNNTLTVGDILGNDGKVYGYGQAHEPGDMGGAGVPLGTRGEIVGFEATDEYIYTAGDASALYTGAEYDESGSGIGWPLYSSGDLDTFIRHVVFLRDLQAFVMFDYVVSPVAQQVNWWYTALDIYDEVGPAGGDSIAPTINVTGDLITEELPGDANQPDSRRIEIQVLEPSSFDYRTDSDTGVYSREFSYLLLWPAVDSTTPKFLTVTTVDDKLSTSVITPTRISQNNCIGTSIVSGGSTYLTLFSSDGNPVSEWIDLGGYYQSADGNPYEFNGTQVLADFATYQVMRLEPAAGNQAPVLASIGDKSVHVDLPLEFTVSATDLNGDPLTYSASNLPSWASFNPATRTFSGTADQIGTYANVQFSVSDGTLTDSENITITVTVNQAPALASPGNKSVNEGAALTFTLSATDADNDTLTYSSPNLPSGANLNANTGAFSWTPAYNQAGTYANIQFIVSDSQLTDTESITVTVNNVNRAPVLASIGNKTVTEGQLLQFTVSASDPNGENLTYSASNLPLWASFNPATRTCSGTPNQAGTYANIQFTVSDGLLTNTKDITITVIQLDKGDTTTGIHWYRTWWLWLIIGLVISAIGVTIYLSRRSTGRNNLSDNT